MKILEPAARGPAFALLLCLLAASCAGPGAVGPPPPAGVPAGEGIRGTLAHEGRPVKDAYVYVYRRYSANFLGPADFASAPSAADGSYAVELVGGSYYIVARKWQTGQNSGPLAAGDLYGVYPENPVSVTDGQYTLANLELVRMRDPLFFRSQSRKETKSGIRGTIVDSEGNPVPWVFAMAYTTPDMKRVPEFTSAMTDEDGKFAIFLPRGGKYWLAARKNIRERPVPGEPYGLYRETEDHSIVVPEDGFVEDVTVVLQPYRRGIQD